MRAIKVIFALSLGVSGILGCTTNERLYHQAQSLTVAPLVTAAPPAPALGATETQAPLTEDPQNLELSSAPISDPQFEQRTLPTPADPLEEKKAGEEKPKLATPAKAAALSAAAESSHALQADNRLLELLERDLDNAVQTSNEHRRLQFSPQVVENPKVRHFINYYSNTGKHRFRELLSRSGRYMPMIAKVLAQEGLPEQLGYLALLESEFDVNVTSRNGAVGLWQFIPATGRRYGLRIDEWIDERRDPVKATRAAAAYLKDLHDYFGRWFLATAAYNAGPGTIDRALQQSGAKDFWSIKAKAQLSNETRNFVPKFIAIALIAMDPQKYGVHDIQYKASLDYEEIEVAAPMPLSALAETVETSVAALRELNPALLKPIIPPGTTPFRVNVPVGKAEIFVAKTNEKTFEKEPAPVRLVTHEVKKGETLFSIARYYGLEARALMEFNSLRTPRLRIGQRLQVFLQSFRRFR
jgi:membrane-bound lytic murein transglycosylase D